MIPLEMMDNDAYTALVFRIVRPVTTGSPTRSGTGFWKVTRADVEAAYPDLLEMGLHTPTRFKGMEKYSLASSPQC